MDKLKTAYSFVVNKFSTSVLIAYAVGAIAEKYGLNAKAIDAVSDLVLGWLK